MVRWRCCSNHKGKMMGQKGAIMEMLGEYLAIPHAAGFSCSPSLSMNDLDFVRILLTLLVKDSCLWSQCWPLAAIASLQREGGPLPVAFRLSDVNTHTFL